MLKKQPSDGKKTDQTADVIELKKEGIRPVRKAPARGAAKRTREHIQDQYDTKPKLFISHKHSDKDIAIALAEFLNKSSAYRLDTHLSSRHVTESEMATS